MEGHDTNSYSGREARKQTRDGIKAQTHAHREEAVKINKFNREDEKGKNFLVVKRHS